jgi:hypothetical protein
MKGIEMQPHSNLDSEQVTRFLKLIDPLKTNFTFQTFHDKKPPTNSDLARVVQSPGAQPTLLQLHAHGAGIYLTVNEADGKGRKSENIIRIRAVWHEDDDGFTGPFPLPPSMVVETSPGHSHRYWLIDSNWPADEQGRIDFAAVMERMVESYGSDKNAKDICRVLRVPGFLHRKDKPHLVRIVEASGKRYSRAQLLAAFPPVERQKKQSTQRKWTAQEHDDERIREALHYINADDREVWMHVGMALKAHMGESARPLWDDWSLRSDKFHERDQDKTWESFKRDGIGIGTVFHYARQSGWQKGNGSAAAAGIGGNGPLAGERSIVAIRANTLKPESISWAWKDRFAFGKMAMIAGDPGLGKSTVLVEIAALHSRGGDFPCNEGKAIQCETAILTAEDGLRDTLVPRLMAAEADLSKIHFITGTKTDAASDGDAAMFDIAQDVASLRKFLKENPKIKILIIDPLTAYLGPGAKAKENTDIRRVLTPLIKLIDDFGVLLLANNHLNKHGGKALYRVLDSIAFVALGRIIHLVAEDADNHDLKKFICSKINIGSKPLGLTYIVQKVWINGVQGEQIETSRISWGTQHIDETADQALGSGDDTPTMADEAETLLREALAGSRMAVHDIEAEARAAGMLGPAKEIKNSKPFRTACERLGIIHEREGFGPGAQCYWKLP